MVVAVDIGNSAIKLAFETDRSKVMRIDASSIKSGLEKILKAALTDIDPAKPKNWFICSVDQHQTEELTQWIRRQYPGDDVHVILASDVPLDSAVEDRNALGRDRLLASWYAMSLAGSDQATAVIDAGTAVTIDVVADGIHQGGLIFPGPRTSLSALKSGTQALPDLSDQRHLSNRSDLHIGRSTRDAILLGVHQLQFFGIIAMIESLQEKYPQLQTFCCGGALTSTADVLPKNWVHKPNLVTDAIFALAKRILR